MKTFDIFFKEFRMVSKFNMLTISYVIFSVRQFLFTVKFLFSNIIPNLLHLEREKKKFNSVFFLNVLYENIGILNI